MNAPKKRSRIKYGHISLPFYSHDKGWRWAWKDPLTGVWKYGTRRLRKDAVNAAHQQAVILSGQTADLSAALTHPPTVAKMRRFIASDISDQDLEVLRQIRENGITPADLERLAETRKAEVHLFGIVATEFLAAKESARGLSRRNIKSLQGHVDSLKEQFGDEKPLGDITTTEIEKWINRGSAAARTRKNRRGAAVTLWRWARKRRYLADETTAAERTERPIVPRGVPSTFTPTELTAMWEVCPDSHRPWLAIASWAGVRGEEMYQEDPDSGKDVIRWRDFSGGHLEIRPNVAKTGVRRIIPLAPTLSAFLAQERLRRSEEPDDAAVCLGRPPSRDLPVINRAVTTILGEVVGGWKRNALRHSFISYRAVQIGLAKTAMEAGNSESEAKRSYHDAMTEADALAWFNPFGSSSEVLSEVSESNIISIR